MDGSKQVCVILIVGDIAQIDSRGCLSIIDRKKNLIKLAHGNLALTLGEYIAIEKLESIYKTSTLVQHILVYANPEKSFCVALVVPIEKELKVLGVSNNVEGIENFNHHEDIKDVKGIKALTKLVFDDLVGIAKKTGLKPAEIIGGCVLIGEDWTPQNNMLTAAMKLQRRFIHDRYKDKIQELYA